MLLVVALITINACKEESFTAFLVERPAPEAITSEVVVSNDNTGNVTVTPTSIGAFSFDIFFGEMANEEPVILGLNKQFTYAYSSEGTYTIRIIANATNGKTTESTTEVVIDLSNILNFMPGITATDGNPAEVTFAPTAEQALSFDILFGDTENEEPTTINAGESVVHTYPPFDSFTATIVAKGVNGKTLELTETIMTGVALQLPITFDDPQVIYETEPFGGTTFEVVDNPDMSGANDVASRVGAVTNSGVNWEGVTIPLDVQADFSGEDKVITMKFWSDQAVPVRLDLSAGVNGERAVEVSANHSGSGWEVLEFNFFNAVKTFIDGMQGVGEPLVPDGEYAELAMFIDGPGTATGTFYFDDVEQTIDENGGSSDCSDVFSAPISFENSEMFSPFGGASYEIVDNPDLSGANTEATKVGAFTNSGAAFEGYSFDLSTPTDFSGDDKTVKLKFWSDVSISIRLDMDKGVTDERAVEVIVSHGGTGWEVLTFDYANGKKTFLDGMQGAGEPLVPTGQYAGITIFIDGPGTTAGTFYIDDIGGCDDSSSGGGGGGGSAESVFDAPISFENGEDFPGFGGASYEIVDNPDASGANPTVSKVGAMTNAGNAFEGYSHTLSTPSDFSGTNKVIKIKFWSDVSTAIRMDMDNGVTDERAVEVIVNHGGTGWEELTFDYNNAVKTFLDGMQGAGEPLVPTGQYGGITIFIDGPGTTAGTFYIDDIE